MDRKVLLVDDEAGLRRNLSVSLLQHDYEIDPCENGLQALNKLKMYQEKGIPLDYAVVDIKLPDIDGVKLVKVIKYKYPGLPVIVITGYGDEELAEELRKHKIQGYLDKPFNVEELTSVFEHIDQERDVATHTAEKPETGTSLSAYAMVQIDKPEQFIDTYREFYFMDNLVYCDATKGEYDLIMLLQAANEEELQKVAKGIADHPHVANMLYVPTAQPLLTNEMSDILSSVDAALGKDAFPTQVPPRKQRQLSTYVLLQVEKEKFNTLYPILHLTDNVISCDVTKGAYDIVLLMQGRDFATLNKVIEEKISMLDGVIRVKKCPIIKMLEM